MFASSPPRLFLLLQTPFSLWLHPSIPCMNSLPHNHNECHRREKDIACHGKNHDSHAVKPFPTSGAHGNMIIAPVHIQIRNALAIILHSTHYNQRQCKPHAPHHEHRHHIAFTQWNQPIIPPCRIGGCAHSRSLPNGTFDDCSQYPITQRERTSDDGHGIPSIIIILVV